MVVKTWRKWSTWLVLTGMSGLLIANAYAGSVLSAGTDHVCGIKDDSTLICWGDNSQNQADPPDGTFKEVSAGFYFNCALSTEGTVACWGRDTAGETSPPPGQFIQIEVGGNHACALAADGAPVCWGANGSSQVSYPPGPFQQLTLGDAHSCGLKADGTVECWGNGDQGQANIAADTFSSIVAGYQTTCGIKTDGVAMCWGKEEKSYGYLTQIDFGVTGPGTGHSKDEGNPILCGLKADKTLSCPSFESVPSGVFSYVTVGGIHLCYFRCGNNPYWRLENFACGIRENGMVACWGTNHNNRATPPVGITLKQPTGFTPPSNPGYTQADIERARQEAQDACKAAPVSCGIDLTGEVAAAVINQDLSLHIDRMQYQSLTGTQILWADLVFGGTNEEGQLMWILGDYGEVE
jgi:alpha-tubulin suppressor-like RCC1 family protein